MVENSGVCFFGWDGGGGGEGATLYQLQANLDLFMIYTFINCISANKTQRIEVRKTKQEDLFPLRLY